MSGDIPKFKSFKPKSVPPSSAALGERRSRDHDREKRHHHRSRKSIPDTSSEPSERREVRVEQWHGDSHGHISPGGDGQADTLFMIDRTGDPKNWTYGSLHRYTVPKYGRFGHGKILGMDAFSRIDRDASSTGEVFVSRPVEDARHRSRSLLHTTSSTLQRHSWRLVRPNVSAVDALDSDFVPLSGSRRRKRKRRGASPETDSIDYRSIDGKAKAIAIRSDPDSDLTTDASGDESSDLQHAARQRNAMLVRLTQQEPQNTQTWHALVEHQLHLIRPDGELKNLTSTERRALADLRIGIYQKALPMVNESSKAVVLEGMLSEGAHVWDRQTSIRKWTEVLEEHPTLLELWVKHIDTIHVPVNDFKYEEIRESSVRVLNRIDSIRKAPKATHDPEELAFVHAYALIRIIKLIHDCGYEEASSAVLQGLMMLHSHESAPSSFEQRFSELERFWDDELPRFGDTEQLVAVADTSATRHDGEPSAEDTQGQFLNFASREFAMSSKHELSAKTIDETNDEVADDAFHVVLFADIKDVLLATSAGLDFDMLLDVLFHFFGLPPLPILTRSRVPPWRRDLGLVSQAFHPEDTRICLNGPSLDSSAFPFTVSALMLENECLFPEALKTRPAILNFLTAALQSLATEKNAHSHLRCYYLAFCSKYNPQLASKVAKRMLKQHSTDANLYSATALVEASLGNRSKASTIWISVLDLHTRAIQFSNGSSDDTQTWQSKVAAMHLAHDWAWAEMTGDNESQAMKSLLSAWPGTVQATGAEAVQLSSTTVLLINRDLLEGFEAGVTRGEPDIVVMYSSAQCLFEYLYSGSSMTTALALLTKHLDVIQTSSTSKSRTMQAQLLNEAVHMIKVRMINYHLDRHRPYRPADLMQTITESLAQFPSNPDLLKVYSRLTSGLDLLDARLKNLDRPWLRLDEKTHIVNWTFAIGQEIARYNKGIGTKDVVRSMFNRALLDPTTRAAHCPALWEAWLRFELEVLKKLVESGGESWQVGKAGKGVTPMEKQVRQVRMVFFDGLRMIPFSRDWILTGLYVFDQEGAARMSKAELRSVYQVLFERDMRVRTEMA
ncbi:hypothetical protein CAC42_8205 [Sphaceloma murrayae]|uniref:DUF1740-domain-containing protein n=1 Tax=Sphaceloma murrayae TaxID=2082308 RepID=A0A2K1QJ55_9PEZI|nr:hypothetical protein CAC42_8205 [Sphaceloma murrayae]